MREKKVSIIGVGRVGSVTAFSLVSNVPNLGELALINSKDEHIRGEALDLSHAAHAMRKDIAVVGGTSYSLVEGSDVVVISAGKGRGFVSSEEQVKINTPIVTSIARRLAEASPDSVIVMVTNPNDAMTFLAREYSGFPRQRVIGSGGLLDMTRLHFMGKAGFVMGAHSGKLLSDNPDVSSLEMETLRKSPMAIVELKQSTQWGPAICISRLVDAILNDKQETMPCSCVLEGEYGLSGVALGIPAVIGKEGVKKIVPLDLNEEQKRTMHDSAELIRQNIQQARNALR